MNPCIVYLAQNTPKDPQYGRDSRSMLEQSLDLLFLNYNNEFKRDILIFHEGDFNEIDQKEIRKGRSQIYFKEIHFELPKFLSEDEVPVIWTDGKGSFFGMGHRHMCYFYGYRIFNLLLDMGYDWMMRMDDDSFVHSPINYDFFDFMKSNNYRYGYRVDILESRQSSRGFGEMVNAYVTAENLVPSFWKKSKLSLIYELIIALEAVIRWTGNKLGISRDKLMPSALRVHPYWCYYNNFYVTDLKFWVQPEVKAFLDFISRTGGTYKYRWNDLLIQATAVQLFLKEKEVHKFTDWIYEHASIQNGRLIFGGIFPSKSSKTEVIRNFRSLYGKLKTPYFWSK